MSQSNLTAHSGDTETKKVEFMSPSLGVPDAASSAQAALTNALSYCVEKIKAGTPATVKEQVKAGDRAAREYLTYQLGRQIAEHLGAFDDDVRAVYAFEYDATSDDLSFGELGGLPSVHLIASVNRKTAALSSLITALDRALCDVYANTFGSERPNHLLDIQVVDDKDVSERRGYGALLASIHHRPMKIWSR